MAGSIIHEDLEMYRIDEDDSVSKRDFDIMTVASTEINFVPRLNKFGAPSCVCLNSVTAIVFFCIGMVIGVSGGCILIFFNQEPTIHPLAYTLITLGIVMFISGNCMLMSEFICGNCFGKLYSRLKAAPLKNAIKRREKVLASRLSSQNSQLRIINSRAGSVISLPSSVVSKNPA
uniref:Uncharacterized protein n=1 Tax=Rhabditophanes sp. KR3021 TaxID=114890 RepID=A0AC35TNM5_9BILA